MLPSLPLFASFQNRVLPEEPKSKEVVVVVVVVV